MVFNKEKPTILQFHDVSQIENLVAERKSFRIYGVNFDDTFDQCMFSHCLIPENG